MTIFLKYLLFCVFIIIIVYIIILFSFKNVFKSKDSNNNPKHNLEFSLFDKTREELTSIIKIKDYVQADINNSSLKQNNNKIIDSNGQNTSMLEPVISPVTPLIPKKDLKNYKIQGKSYMLYDINNRNAILTENPNISVKIASLSKILTSLVILENIDINTAVGIPEKINNFEEEARVFEVGDKIKVEDLIKAMLVSSSNESALILSQYYESKLKKDFIDQLNKKAKEIGMNQTSFSNPVGYDTSPNVSNAFDLTKLMEYAKNYPIFQESAKQKQVLIRGKEKNYLLRSTNEQFIDKLNNTNDFKLLLVKTGTTLAAKENLAIYLNYKGRDIVLVILNSSERINDFNKLIDYIQNFY